MLTDKHYVLVETVAEHLEKQNCAARFTFNSNATWVLHSLPTGYSFSNVRPQFSERTLAGIAKMCVLNRDKLEVYIKVSLDGVHGFVDLGYHEHLEIGDVVQV